MFDMLDSWMSLSLSATRMMIDAQSVIGLRLLKIANGGPQAEVEAQRMVIEKGSAFVEAQIALATAVATGQGHKAPHRALKAYSKRVHANHRRLSRG